MGLLGNQYQDRMGWKDIKSLVDVVFFAPLSSFSYLLEAFSGGFSNHFVIPESRDLTTCIQSVFVVSRLFFPPWVFVFGIFNTWIVITLSLHTSTCGSSTQLV